LEIAKIVLLTKKDIQLAILVVKQSNSTNYSIFGYALINY